MQRTIDFLDTQALDIAVAALDAAVERCGPLQDDTQELRLAAARHILGLMQKGEQDRSELRRSAVEYIRTSFR